MRKDARNDIDDEGFFSGAVSMNLPAASCRVSKTSIRNIYVLHPVASHRELSS